MCFTPPFDVKCKTLLGLAKSRIKLQRHKREHQLKQMKQELTSMLKAKQEPSAHLKVEQIHREQKIMAAYEVLDLFCEQIVSQLPSIKAQKQCPIDLREAVASIIYAAPRCLDLPELKKIGGLLSAKYGKEFTTAAAELRQDNGVNRVVIEKLSVEGPSMEVKMKLMKDIAVEQGIDWDPTHLQSQVLAPHEDVLMSSRSSSGVSSYAERIVEPNLFVEARESTTQSSAFLGERQFLPFIQPITEFERTFLNSQSSTQGLTPSRQGSSGSAAHVLSATFVHSEETVKHFIPSVQYADQVESSFLPSGPSSPQSARYSQGSSGRASHVSSAAFHQYEEVEYVPTEIRKRLQHVISATCKAAESALHAAAVARNAVELLTQNSELESSLDIESYSDGNDDDSGRSDSAWHSTPMSNRHGDNRVSSQGLDSWNASSETLGDRHSNMRPLESNSLDMSKTSPIFDPYKQDDSNRKHADVGAHSIPEESSMRGAPTLPEALTPSLTKATSFTHPKLPDYDNVFAHFRTLKAMKAKNNGSGVRSTAVEP